MPRWPANTHRLPWLAPAPQLLCNVRDAARGAGHGPGLSGGERCLPLPRPHLLEPRPVSSKPPAGLLWACQHGGPAGSRSQSAKPSPPPRCSHLPPCWHAHGMPMPTCHQQCHACNLKAEKGTVSAAPPRPIQTNVNDGPRPMEHSSRKAHERLIRKLLRLQRRQARRGGRGRARATGGWSLGSDACR